MRFHLFEVIVKYNKVKKYLFDRILIIFYSAFDIYGFLLQWLYNSQNVLHDKFLYKCVAKLLLCNKNFIKYSNDMRIHVHVFQ